nr:DUF6790 family protein [Acuticoccus kalidii]
MSIAVDWLRGAGDLVVLLGKWFVFWGGGVRLLLAGLSQVMRPAVTSGILGIKDPAAEKVVAELGFANCAIGLVGILSLFVPGWTAPAGLVSGLFLTAAGVKHARNAERTLRENVAMGTDLFVALMIAIYLVGWLIR